MSTLFGVTGFQNRLLNALVRATALQPLCGGANTALFFYAGAPGTFATFLGTLNPLTGTTWNAAVGGVADLVTSLTVTPGTTGTAGHAWFDEAGGGIDLMDTSVGVSGSGLGCIVSTVSFVSGTPVTISALSLKIPQSNAGATLRFSLAVRNRLIDLLTTRSSTNMNFGNNAGSKLAIYSGAQPTNPDDVATGTKLVEFTMSGPSHNAPSGGSIVLTASKTATASATGTAGYARWTSSDGASFVIDGSVGTAGTDFIIDTTAIVSAATITLSNATLTF